MGLKLARQIVEITFGLVPVILVLLMACSFGISQAQSQESSGAKSTAQVCQFRPVNVVGWKGSCGRLGGQIPTLTIAPARAITTGVWRKGASPTRVLAGDMTYSDDVDQIEIEIYAEGSGILRASDGWFPISKFTLTTEAMELQIDFSHEVPPADLDREIVRELQ